MLLFISLVLTAGLVYWLRWRLQHKKWLEFSDKVPGPPTIPILGNALQLMVPSEELAHLFGKMILEYGDIFRVWLGPDMNIFVSDPDDIKTLLTSPKINNKGPQYKYIQTFCGNGILSGSGPKTNNKGPQCKYIQTFCGNGILSGSGPTWRTSRKAALPNYGKKALRSYSGFVDREANETVKRMRARVGGKPFDVYDEIIMTTTYIVCQSLFGLTKEQTLNLPDLERFVHDAHDVYLIVFKRMTTWYLQIDPIFWMTKYHQKHRDIYKKIKVMMHTIVQHRLNALDAMDHDRKIELLKTEEDHERNTELSGVDRIVLSNPTMSYDETLKQTFTLLTASQEATAKVTSYLLLMMAFHPECQEKLYGEIREVIGDNDRDVTEDDLKQMTYLDMVFKEVVRLFPTGVMLQRTIGEDITISRKRYFIPFIDLGKGTLPAGSSLVISLYHLQRDRRFWTNPNAFDPERFSPENIKLQHPHSYIPFSLGPMDCVGRFYAQKIVKTISVKMVREFRLTSPETYNDMRLALAVSVMCLSGFPVQLHSRK